MPFHKGDAVAIDWAGDGVVWDVTGGPQGDLYRVLMDAPDESGHRTILTVPAEDLLPGPPMPTYAVGDRVTYRGRAGVVTDESGGLLVVVLAADPVENPWGEVSEPSIHILPHWHLTARNR